MTGEHRKSEMSRIKEKKIPKQEEVKESKMH